MKRPFLVGRVLKDAGLYRPKVRPLGRVELRPPGHDTPAERAALAGSLLDWKEISDHNIAMRMTAITEAEDPSRAHALAEPLFEEALDVLDSGCFGIGQFALLNAGFSRDLKTGEISPRAAAPRFGPFPAFQVADEVFEPYSIEQFLLGESCPDLGKRLLRSLHWTRKARWEPNPQLRILFSWFSLEAIWLLKRDEDIIPRVMWSLGYPMGRQARQVPRALVAELRKHPRYRAWGTQLHTRLGRIKGFRNESVHNGFRPQDIPEADLNSFAQLMRLTCPRVHQTAKEGIAAGVRTGEDLLDVLPEIFQMSTDLVNQVHHTLIPLLETPDASA